MGIIRILTVDDHEMTMLGYKFILEKLVVKGKQVAVDMASTFEEGVAQIQIAAESKNPFDIIFLDVQLFPPGETQIHTGEDLGKLAKKYSPQSKIVFLSAFGDNMRINTIFQTVDPDGYLVKTDIDPSVLEEAVNKVLDDIPYYSKKALQAIRVRMATDINLDENDKKILYHLAEGTKTKDLETFIELSLSSIENRKRYLKTLFGTEKENDLALLVAARNKGFI